MATLKDIFDRQFKDVTFNKAFCERIVRFSQNFMTRNDDHSSFFGGYYMGVNPVRFFESDRETWYEEVLQVDETLLAEDFKNADAVNHSFKVSGDVFNYTPAYVAHRLMKATGVPQKLRHDAIKHAFMVLHFRFLTSLLQPRFRHPADPRIAEAAYNSLSLKFDLRRYGSWRALIEARAQEIPWSPTYKKYIEAFSPDPMIIRVVTDTQGRIREVVKKLYVVYLNTIKSGDRVKTVSATVISTDGETLLRDRSSGYAGYLRYIHQVVPRQRSLIREELLDVIADAIHTMPPQLLRESLEYLSNHYRKPRHDYLEELVKEDLLYVFEYLQSNRLLLARSQNLSELLARLKALFMASRSSDPEVLRLRSLSDQLVRASIKTKNNAVVASVRTGVLLYLALRALTRQHYS